MRTTNSFGKDAKRILYRLSRKSFLSVNQLKSGFFRNQWNEIMLIQRLIAKGLVGKECATNTYALTDKGKEIAKPIVDEIDEYKRW